MNISNIELIPQGAFEMKKGILSKIIVVFFILVATPFVLYGGLLATYYVKDLRNDFWQAVTNKADLGQHKFYLNEVTNFQWDTVCVIAPYSLTVGRDKDELLKRNIKGELGKFKKEIPDTESDGYWAFAFIEKGNVVAIKEKGRAYYMDDNYKDNCIPNSKAFFLRDGAYLYISDGKGKRS